MHSKKLQAFCKAQGGIRTPLRAAHRHDLLAGYSGEVVSIDCRHLARVNKLAGALSYSRELATVNANTEIA